MCSEGSQRDVNISVLKLIFFSEYSASKNYLALFVAPAWRVKLVPMGGGGSRMYDCICIHAYMQTHRHARTYNHTYIHMCRELQNIVSYTICNFTKYSYKHHCKNVVIFVFIILSTFASITRATHTHVHIYMYIFLYTYVWHARANQQANINTRMKSHTYMHTYIHIYI